MLQKHPVLIGNAMAVNYNCIEGTVLFSWDGEWDRIVRVVADGESRIRCEKGFLRLTWWILT